MPVGPESGYETVEQHLPQGLDGGSRLVALADVMPVVQAMMAQPPLLLEPTPLPVLEPLPDTYMLQPLPEPRIS